MAGPNDTTAEFAGGGVPPHVNAHVFEDAVYVAEEYVQLALVPPESVTVCADDAMGTARIKAAALVPSTAEIIRRVTAFSIDGSLE
ncbi:hypothetical protein [Usitatibacter palustris]|uniref:hypothetical protein n=1 Tax=Usitatibacter palustris TaxID=2732487 RepID=UPI0014879741|nr:hypothetical protein [Usitatibacter palustris]